MRLGQQTQFTMKHQPSDRSELHVRFSAVRKVMSNPNAWMPFGCPVYVLNNALQNQQQIKGKWKHRSRVGVYLGRSPLHAATVALVLSLQTGRVSPQFHVQFDPTFQTVKSSFGGRSPESRWQRICGFVSDALTKKKDAADGPEWAPEPVVVQIPSDLQDMQAADLDVEDDDRSVSTIGSLHEEGFQTDEDQTLRRSNRVRKPVERFKFEAMLAEIMDTTTDSEGAEFEDPHSPAPGEIFCMKAMFGDDTEQPEHPLLAFGASNDPDTLYLHEAIRAPDKKQFKEAMVKEFNGQWDNGNFKLIEWKQLKRGTPVLPGVWALKRKRRILSGEVYKHKAR